MCKGESSRPRACETPPYTCAWSSHFLFSIFLSINKCTHWPIIRKSINSAFPPFQVHRKWACMWKCMWSGGHCTHSCDSFGNMLLTQEWSNVLQAIYTLSCHPALNELFPPVTLLQISLCFGLLVELNKEIVSSHAHCFKIGQFWSDCIYRSV